LSDENAAYPKTASGAPLALEQRGETGDGRRFSPSIARNRDIVRDIFQKYMPNAGQVLEIASGTGEHGAHIISALPDLSWTYSDIDPSGRASQAAWARHSGYDRLKGPLEIDVTERGWAERENLSSFDGVFCANMIHIAPFSAAEGLFRGLGEGLRKGGRFMLYGPFAQDGEIAPSNARFSEDLKRRDPSWGVRDLVQDILPLAASAGLVLAETIEMPANNLSVIYERASAERG